MFGMEKKQDKLKSAFQFDLEKDILSNPARQRELAKLIEARILKIKDMLRKGDKKEVYDCLGTLLNGYHALATVLGRAAKVTKGK